jgi:hypothetical protein
MWNLVSIVLSWCIDKKRYQIKVIFAQVKEKPLRNLELDLVTST